jgi:hypothetical protein
VLHLWHGKLENRGYGSRYAILNECHYDPFSDIQSDRNGALIFAQGSEQLQQRIERFLSSRQDA